MITVAFVEVNQDLDDFIHELTIVKLYHVVF